MKRCFSKMAIFFRRAQKVIPVKSFGHCPSESACSPFVQKRSWSPEGWILLSSSGPHLAETPTFQNKKYGKMQYSFDSCCFVKRENRDKLLMQKGNWHQCIMHYASMSNFFSFLHSVVTSNPRRREALLLLPRTRLRTFRMCSLSRLSRDQNFRTSL